MPVAPRSRIPSSLPVVAVAFLLAVALPLGPLVPQAKADGCGPGTLGSATRWKDRNAIFDFAGLCDWHDRCYGARGFGWDPVSHPGRALVPYPRDWCDSGFHRGMRRSCDRRRATGRLCMCVADLFHSLVSAFGERWYRKADGHRTLRHLTWP